MIKSYDFVFLTNIPSFYKINLYNNLSKKFSVKVIFFSKTSAIRQGDFYKGEMKFDHTYLTDVPYENRNKLATLYKVYKELKNIEYKKLIYPGWELKELLLLSLVTPYNANAIAVETCILETKKTPLIWWVKKQYVNRMSLALPSGELQADIFSAMGYRGKVIPTNGVGIPHDSFYDENDRRNKIGEGELKYLYVGRLSEEKNPEIICKVASELRKKLTVVGYGPQESMLRNKYSDYIKFTGLINNDELKTIYKEHDVLVVPSRTEAWGLVIDEALCSGLVILASDQVGSKNDLILNKGTGSIFDYQSETALAHAIQDIETNYKIYKNNVNNLKLKDLFAEKIEPYTLMLSEYRDND